MNKSINPGDSSRSGGPDGTWKTFAVAQDDLSDLPNVTKNGVHFGKFLHYLAREGILSFEKTSAFSVFIECDGGTDHDLTFLSNPSALF